MDDHPSPLPVPPGVARDVAEAVLRAQLPGDPVVHAVQLGEPAREEGVPPGRAGDRGEEVARAAVVTEGAGPRRGGDPEADRVHRHLRPPRRVEHLVVAQERRGICSVRQQDHGAFAHPAVGRTPGQIAQRKVHRVVQTGRPLRPDRLDSRLEQGLVGSEVLDHGVTMVEADDLGRVHRPQRVDEPQRRTLDDRHVRLHGQRAVDEDRDRDRRLLLIEDRDLLGNAVLEDGEVLLLEIGDVPAAGVGHGDAQVDDVDVRPEARECAPAALRAGAPARNAHRNRRYQGRRPVAHPHVVLPVELLLYRKSKVRAYAKNLWALASPRRRPPSSPRPASFSHPNQRSALVSFVDRRSAAPAGAMAT